MNQHHLRSLLRVELRRNRRHVLVGLGIAAAAVPVLSLFDRADPSPLGTVLLVATMSSSIGVVGNTFRDKFNGQLEFFTTLPVRSSTLAAAAFLANALAFLPVLAVATGVVHWALLPKLGVDAGVWSLVAAAASWLLVSAFAGLSCGMVVRFDINKLSLVPAAGVVVGVLGGDHIDGWVRAKAPAVLELAAASADMAWVLGAAAFFLLFGTMLGAGFFVACQGYERYRPKPDVLEW